MAKKLQNTIIHQPMQRRNYMIAHINNKHVKTLIDSGSVVTLITERFDNKHKLPVPPTSDPAVTQLLSANTGDIDIIGTSEFVMKVSGLSYQFQLVWHVS